MRKPKPIDLGSGQAIMDACASGYEGCWIPLFVLEMVESQRITATEAILLATINALTRHKQPFQGCYASNEFLARRIGMTHARSVSNMIARLKQMGFVQVIKSKYHRRVIATSWAIENAHK